jgi:hypothetical protein
MTYDKVKRLITRYEAISELIYERVKTCTKPIDPNDSELRVLIKIQNDTYAKLRDAGVLMKGK